MTGRQSEDRVTARPLLSDAEIDAMLDLVDAENSVARLRDYTRLLARELQQARAAIRTAESSLWLALRHGDEQARLDYVERARDMLRACLPAEDDAGSGVGVRG